jgi:L-aspartate oxidase
MKTDFLVLGSGIGGLSFALEASDIGEVVICTKRDAMESNTRYAQGGIATVLDKEDSFELHVQDTLNAGAGLCKKEIVEMCVRSGPDRIKWLLKQGVRFSSMSKDKEIEFDLGREGGHSRRRILHVKDLTGFEVEKVLLERVRARPNCVILENHMGLDLLWSEDAMGRRVVRGAMVIERKTGSIKRINARATILATGGAGKVYLYTSNPDVATGDGVAMAYRAGARVANLEFFQFHPTCLYHPKAKSFLISEAVRGEGAVLRRIDGTPFMAKYHKDAELAPRDIVALAIDREMKESGDDHVLLDATNMPASFIEERFPHIFETCLKFGIDMRREPIPVVPAAHYMCGGVVTDEWGATNLVSLYAVGETACTGLHGANRLASNSLLEALVFAHRAAEHIKQNLDVLPSAEEGGQEEVFFGKSQHGADVDTVMISQDWDEVRRLMWNYVGIVRSVRRLLCARRRLDLLKNEVKEFMMQYPMTSDLAELRNIVTLASLIVECALWRQESRGLHFNVDYPERDDERFLRDTLLWAGKSHHVV